MALKDILNDIEFKGNATKIVLKWVVGIASVAIVGAFAAGQLKTKFFNKINNIEKFQKEMQLEMRTNFAELNQKIDNMYEAGLEGFESYRIFNNQQLELIIEFGQSSEKANQELLKRMLSMNSEEKARQIETQIEEAKKNRPQPVIGAKRQRESDIEFIRLPTEAVVQEVATGISTYYVDGAEKNYLDTLNLERYEIIESKKSTEYEGLYKFIYKDKEEK